MEKTKLDQQIKFMKNLEIDFCFTAYEVINEQENIIGLRPAQNKLNFDDLIKSCDIGLSTVDFKKRFIF